MDDPKDLITGLVGLIWYSDKKIIFGEYQVKLRNWL